MVGRLVEQQDVGLRRHDAGKCRPPRLAAGQLVGPFLAGQAEMVEQVGGPVRIVGRTEPGLDIGPDGGENLPCRASAAGSGRWPKGAGRPRRPAARPGRRRSSAASTCPSRCGRPARCGRRPPPTSSAPSSSGVPPNVSTMPSSFRIGAPFKLRSSSPGIGMRNQHRAADREGNPEAAANLVGDGQRRAERHLDAVERPFRAVTVTPERCEKPRMLNSVPSL